MKFLFTVAAAVVLSVVISVYATSFRKVSAQTDTVRAKSVEIVDANKKVRIEIGIANSSGHELPQMIFRDEKGNTASLLMLNEAGNGTLYFSGNGTEGKVALGYLWGSDSLSPGETDPLGAWGIRVLGREGFQTAMGISNSGKLVSPSSETSPHVR